MGVHADAHAAWFDDYVESVATGRVTPVRLDRDLAQAQVRDLSAALSGANAEVGRLTAENAELDATNDRIVGENNDLNIEVAHLRRRIAELEADQPQPRKMLIGTATAPSGGTTEQRVAFVRQLKADIEAAGGTLSIVHTFSGGTIPLFGTGTPDNAVAKSFAGMTFMVNVKTPGGDWAGVPSGKYRPQWRALLDSALAFIRANGGRVQITCDHEPENDGKSAAEWRAAQAWYATEFYAHEIAQHGDYVFVLMAYTMEPSSGRNIADWDVFPLLPAGIRHRPLMGWDVYFKAQDSVEANWNNRAKRAFDWSAQQGHRVVVFEWAVNNDARVPEAQRGAVIAGILVLFDEAGCEAVAYYPHPGPAAGTNPGPGPDGIKALAAASR